MNQIPLVDLKAAHEEVADEVRAGFDRVLANTAFIGGEEVRRFEREYAAFGGVAHCVLTAAVRVGAHVAVMPQVVLTHDDVVEDFATLASGVRLGGGARLERGAYVGSGALVREGTTVGAWALSGMGSAVLGDVPPGEVWVGSPARRLRAADAPALDELAAPTVGGPLT